MNLPQPHGREVADTSRMKHEIFEHIDEQKKKTLILKEVLTVKSNFKSLHKLTEIN
jgi:hypothetical protein